MHAITLRPTPEPPLTAGTLAANVAALLARLTAQSRLGREQRLAARAAVIPGA